MCGTFFFFFFFEAYAYGEHYHTVEQGKCVSYNVKVLELKEGQKDGKEEWKKGRKEEITDCMCIF